MNILKDKTFLKIVSIVIVLILVYIFFLSGFTIFRISRFKFGDVFTKLALKIKPPPSYRDKIVVITIDDQSLARSRYRWPWPRITEVELLERLKTYQPKVIGFDIAFIGKSQDETNDILFANQLEQLGNCIISAHFSPRGEYILPLSKFRDVARFGFINKLRDKDNHVRSARAVVLSKKGNVIDYSFETKVISELMDLETIESDSQKITLKDANRRFTIPIDNLGSVRINYRMSKTDFKTVSFWRVVQEDLPIDTFKDKIVLIGATAEVIHDTYSTPLGIMPGVMIGANTIQTILQRDFIKVAPLWTQRIFLLIIGLIVTFFTYRYKLAKAFFLNVFLLSLLFIVYASFFLMNILVDFSGVLFVIIGTFLGISGSSYLRLAIEANILKSQAITDALTGIYGFRYFNLKLKNEVARAKRYNQNLCLLILDIDHFKRVNDTYGHDNGNIILKGIAHIMKERSRRADVVARFGGEEFCVILPQINQDNALIFAERLREKIEKTPFVIKMEDSVNLTITVSIGVSHLNKNKTHTAEALLKSADTALYKAKNSGRNKVCVFRKD